jgi:hypothetical protein
MPSIFRHPSLVVLALRHWTIFVLGWREAKSSSGLTYDDDPWSARSLAYDAGRDLRLWGRS